MNAFLEALKSRRTDVSDWLIHFTKGSFDNATDTLNKILSDRALKSDNGFICFSEAPICEFKKVIDLCNSYPDPRFAPFGVAVKKTWLFDQGGRPVIYGPKAEKADFEVEKHRYRYVEYDPSVLDYSWQREWRICTRLLKICPNSAVVIVPNQDTSVDLTCTVHEDGEYEDGEGINYGWLERNWSAFMLDNLEIHTEGDTPENLINPAGMT